MLPLLPPSSTRARNTVCTPVAKRTAVHFLQKKEKTPSTAVGFLPGSPAVCCGERTQIRRPWPHAGRASCLPIVCCLLLFCAPASMVALKRLRTWSTAASSSSVLISIAVRPATWQSHAQCSALSSSGPLAGAPARGPPADVAPRILGAHTGRDVAIGRTALSASTRSPRLPEKRSVM